MNRLKELRLEKELLQSDIAKIIDKSDRIVGFYETEERDMGTETLSKLADFFNVSIDYLLGKSDIRNPIKIDDTSFANHNGIDTSGLDKEEIDEIKKQVEYMRWKKEQNKKK